MREISFKNFVNICSTFWREEKKKRKDEKKRRKEREEERIE